VGKITTEIPETVLGYSRQNTQERAVEIGAEGRGILKGGMPIARRGRERIRFTSKMLPKRENRVKILNTKC
jgi:hypothetical protein